MRDDTDMDRRGAVRCGAVRTMLGLGALPLVGACARAPRARSALTPRQQAGQRVIFSYPGLTVPAALLRQISAGQAAGVAATAKHFPGLGQAAAAQNTDTGPVTLNVPLASLRARDEAPYPAAIAARVKLVMASWAIYPALDARHPAGLSPAVISGELRGRLGYRGVTITDAIEAGALASSGSSGQRAVLAARAGMDLLLCSGRDPAQGQAVVTALAGALDGGKLAAGDFGAAVQRVTALRNALP